jgi:addiction module RelE/StbE family toxin
MRVRWSFDAEQDRHAIWEYIATDNPRAAARIDTLFDDAARMLADFPLAGHVGRASGTRELMPHESYRLVYEVDGDMVWILALVHTARQWPPEKI